MAKRNQTLSVVSGLSRNLHQSVANHCGGMVRAIALKSKKAPEFCALPQSLNCGDVKNGELLCRGQFELGAQKLDVGDQGSPWTVSSPSEVFANQLHRFAWLDDLAAVANATNKQRKKSKKNLAPKWGTSQQKQIDATEIREAARTAARTHCDGWIENFGDWNPYAWDVDILTDRVFSWFVNWQVLFDSEADPLKTERRRASLYRQLRYLKKRHNWASPGVPRLKTVACLVLAGVCFTGRQDVFFDKGLDILEDEIESQILADGGHVSRNPQDCVAALEFLICVESALIARGIDGSKEIRRAIDRLAPMVDFFSTEGFGMFSFNGGGRGHGPKLKALNEHTRVKSKPFRYAPHMYYQRLEKNGCAIMVDIGGSPNQPYDQQAHLAPLSIEMCTQAGWLLVNCGWNPNQASRWRRSMRGTDAHSGLILGGKDAGRITQSAMRRRAIGVGHAVATGPVKCTRKEMDDGTWLEARDRSYVKKFGLEHGRRLYMDAMGQDIRGEDSLYVAPGENPVSNELIPFEIRFHLHPDVKVTLGQNQKSALLIQPGGHGWQFRTNGGALKIEKSVYLSEGNQPRRSEQIIISGEAYGDSDGQTKSNRVRWALKRLGGIDANGFVNG